MSKSSRYIVNCITLYRVVTAPLLLFLVWRGTIDWFKWLLAISFFTDAVDGYIARRFKGTSIAGSRLDSIGDDLTVLAGIVGMVILKKDFVRAERVGLSILCGLFILQLILALWRYGRQSSFHTYLAKIAAVTQGLFLLSLFFFPKPSYLLFYSMMGLTALDLIEEIVLVCVLSTWETDVKGLYWVWRRRGG